MHGRSNDVGGAMMPVDYTSVGGVMVWAGLWSREIVVQADHSGGLGTVVGGVQVMMRAAAGVGKVPNSG